MVWSWQIGKSITDLHMDEACTLFLKDLYSHGIIYTLTCSVCFDQVADVGWAAAVLLSVGIIIMPSWDLRDAVLSDYTVTLTSSDEGLCACELFSLPYFFFPRELLLKFVLFFVNYFQWSKS
ncbi:hypothetical protein SAY86_023517 [Trapa natans]|uniref:Uncharacterized protein n=1 Tax=Trapa natans TaxID=22666 RepID=A0AAN7R7Y4_TRANT|nr:hypothetical protein SAY86_023517 [Trapa natans]